MTEAWTREEVELIVADYRAMLLAELRGERYSKAGHRRNLQKRLNNRSEGSIEYKHQNISAVLVEQGFPTIDDSKAFWVAVSAPACTPTHSPCTASSASARAPSSTCWKANWKKSSASIRWCTGPPCSPAGRKFIVVSAGRAVCWNG